MASTSFPRANLGSVTDSTGAANICWQAVTGASRVENNRVVTCAGDDYHTIIQGLGTKDIRMRGVVKQTSGGTYGLGQSSTLSDGINIKPFDWTVRKRWPLFDVTGSGDSVKNWEWGIPSIGMNCRGVITSSYSTGFDTTSVSVSSVMNIFGTLAGTLKLNQKVLRVPYFQGGPIAHQFGGQFSGTVTYTPPSATTNFSWLFASPDDPVRGVLTLDVDLASDISHTAILYDIAFSCSAQDGGEVSVEGTFRCDAADA